MITAKEHFGKILKEQLERVELMKASAEWADYAKLDKPIIDVVGGEGLGQMINVVLFRHWGSTWNREKRFTRVSTSAYPTEI